MTMLSFKTHVRVGHRVWIPAQESSKQPSEIIEHAFIDLTTNMWRSESETGPWGKTGKGFLCEDDIVWVSVPKLHKTLEVSSFDLIMKEWFKWGSIKADCGSGFLAEYIEELNTLLILTLKNGQDGGFSEVILLDVERNVPIQTNQKGSRPKRGEVEQGNPSWSTCVHNSTVYCYEVGSSDIFLLQLSSGGVVSWSKISQFNPSSSSVRLNQLSDLIMMSFESYIICFGKAQGRHVALKYHSKTCVASELAIKAPKNFCGYGENPCAIPLRDKVFGIFGLDRDSDNNNYYLKVTLSAQSKR